MSGLARVIGNREFSQADQNLLSQAFQLAEQAHQGQQRLSGEPYITHPSAVAEFLSNLGLDATSIAAALLHDTLEDTSLTHEEIGRVCGKDVVFLVESITKLKAIKYRGPGSAGQKDAHVESLKKMFFAMAQDIRVILIKLADRYHNILTLEHQLKEKRKRIALETLEIYAPIAGRLGMGWLKGQLEDLSFPHAYPEEHKKLISEIKEEYRDRLKYIEYIKPIIARHLRESDVEVLDLHSRAKRYFSLFQKLARTDYDTTKVFDLVALRIVVPDVASCYAALGSIHQFYKPLPGKIKDYIALPKSNGYQSIHTTIFCERGKIVEVQIRTPEMHDHAENGIAAHWAYSESGKRKAINAKQSETEWIAQLKNILKEIQSEEGLQTLKIDFFKNRIFAFTPLGDVKDLPEGATPIDFAYAVHSNVGHATTGATVNGKIVSLDHPLQNGDMIEILKSKTLRPSFDWLKLVKTTHARQCIRSWFKDRVIKNPIKPAPVRKTIEKPKKIPKKDRPLRVFVGGQPDVLYKLGRCCNPTSSERVKGYITRNRGVTIHTISCQNIKNAGEERILNAAWN